MKMPLCQGWIGLVLACQVIWSDVWPVQAPQFAGMTGEVRVMVCIEREGEYLTVAVDKRIVNGDIGRPWAADVKQCWEKGVESYCGEP